MTTITITRSELTGTKRTEVKRMDILFEIKDALRVTMKSLTPAGYTWIRENMDHDEHFVVTLQREFVEEIKELIRNSGLTIQER